METADNLDALSSYVPALVVRRLAVNPAAIAPPSAERYPAAVLFADIVDFTRLAERLSQELGPAAGAELLAQVLNRYFGRFIEIAAEYGGEVVKFAGDALVTLWPARLQPGPGFGADEELALATRRAARCALQLQHALHRLTVAPGVTLAMQLGIGAGYVSAVHLGGVLGRAEFLLSGSPLTQMSEAQALAQPGHVVMAPEAWQLVRQEAHGSQVGGGFYRLLNLPRPPLPAAGAVLPGPGLTSAALQPYIPGAVYGRLDAGHDHWEAELRQVTVLFIHLPSYGTSIKHPYVRTLPQAQEVMRALQTALYRYEGSINKLNVDNKGITLVAALGLPPVAHVDDPLRGVRAACAMQSALRALNRPSAIGVTTGLVFCGPVGNRIRREYTMVGDAVNLASRLMEAVKDANRRDRFAILCDEATYQATRRTLTYDALPPVRLKGRRDPTPAYRPRAEPTGSDEAFTVLPTRATFEGRREELERLLGAVRALRSKGLREWLGMEAGPPILMVEAEAGLGKSRLLQEVADRAERMRIYTLIGRGRSEGRQQPFSAWQEPFARLFSYRPMLSDTRSQWQSRVLSQLPAAAGERGFPALALRYAPLLNAVLPLELPENDFTAGLDEPRRRTATHHFLLRLLQLLLDRPGKERRLPALFLFDDAQLFDPASLELFLAAAEKLSPALFVAALRPVPQATPQRTPFALRAQVYRRLQEVGGHEWLRLEPLTVDETLSVVRRHLGVRELDAGLAQMIADRGQGNPLFSIQLASALLEEGLVVKQQGACVPVSATALAGELPVPVATRLVVTSTLDTLPYGCQLLLKIAGVLAEPFGPAELLAAYPLEATPERLAEQLAQLVELGLFTLGADGYRFKYDCVRRTMTGLLLEEQQQVIAAAVSHVLVNQDRVAVRIDHDEVGRAG